MYIKKEKGGGTVIERKKERKRKRKRGGRGGYRHFERRGESLDFQLPLDLFMLMLAYHESLSTGV